MLHQAASRWPDASEEDGVQRFDGADNAPPGFGPSVVTVGAFDGIHRGHQELVRRAVAHGHAHRLPVVLLTFAPHPQAVLRPEAAPAVLTEPRRKAELVAALGVDVLCVQPFTRELSQLSPEEFVARVLVDRLGARHVVVGENFRFGHRAAGDVAALRTAGEREGFTVDAVPLVTAGGHPWSSSRVRERLAEGDVAGAAEALGRPHRVEGEVVRGDGRGRELGFPTANLHLAADVAIPSDGVYAGWLLRDLDGAPVRLPAAISVGTNPTFDGTGRRVEAHVIDADLDLYGELVAVEFTCRVRDMERFDSVDALVEQMRRDVEQVPTLLT